MARQAHGHGGVCPGRREAEECPGGFEESVGVVAHDACATRDLIFDDVLTPAKQVHYSTLATLRNYAKIMGTDEFLKGN